MIRHLIPRFQWQGWYGDALTMNPNGGREMPNGLNRSMRQAFGHSTLMPEYDEVRGRTVTIQWLWLTIEISMGRVI